MGTYMKRETSPVVTITVRPFHGMWEVVELPGIQPLHASRERAVKAARERLRGRSGVIEIFGPHDELVETIDLRGETFAVRAA